MKGGTRNAGLTLEAVAQAANRSLEGCGIAAVGCSSMWAEAMGGECCCGNLLWQSYRTLIFGERAA